MEMVVNYKNQIPILVELQEFDLKISELKKEQEAKPLGLEELKSKVEEKKIEIENIEKEIKNIKLGIREKELELKSAEDEIKKLQQQLYQVKTNKEYKSLLNEIGGKKADNSVIEDAILDLMEKLDQKELEFNKEKENLKFIQQEYLKEEKKVRREIEDLEAEVKTKEQERAKVAERVNSELLTIYTRLLKNRAGVAIVPVLNEACGGCHLSLRPQIINEIKKADKLVTCERCSRILYLNE